MSHLITVGTVLAIGNVVLFDEVNQTAFGTEHTIDVPDVEPPQLKYGRYVPINWPSGGKPFRF